IYAQEAFGPLQRFLVNGTLDATFQPPLFEKGVKVAAFADGSTVVWLAPGLIRLLPNGAPDPDFIFTADAERAETISQLIALPAGHVLVYGQNKGQWDYAPAYTRVSRSGEANYVYVGPPREYSINGDLFELAGV